MAQVAWRDPWLELVYWDDDRADLAEVWDWHQAGMPEGVYFDDDLDRLSQPRLKPGWSPDLLACSPTTSDGPLPSGPEASTPRRRGAIATPE